MQKISPFLWFENRAEEAAEFYVSVFPDSGIDGTARYGEGEPGPAGSVMTVDFHLAGEHFTALNGGPMFKFSPATSFVVSCDSQAEVDRYWDKLCDGGTPSQCGWVDDKFGVTWQIVPKVLLDYMEDTNVARKGRVTQAMFKMGKLIIADLQAAYEGK
jgi:predicted 3-demethylubiquinone-9 3-methyltransferase (glyoxalase superfamily)